MIVSAGCFSSMRAPSFQSSHETAVIGLHPAHGPVNACQPDRHAYAALLQSHLWVHRAMLVEPEDESIFPTTSRCLHVEVSIP
jgi:hypothetical protein